MRRLSASLLIFALVGYAAPPKAAHGVPNLVQVSPGIWRGGQPTAAGWLYLRSLGVTNVVKLNKSSEGRDEEAVKLGMIVVPVPLSPASAAGVATRPKLTAIVAAAAAIKPGTYVHCTHGQDRTGLVVGAYRVWRCGWSKDAAYREMRNHGFHPTLMGLKTFWDERVH